jgi:predicted ribosome quality control (RQC) complex YloA/Tae2 family protein
MKFREFITKKGTIILAGKDEDSNEELIKQMEPEEYVFHTVASGSPFVNVKGKARLGDLKRAAIICARYSQDWRDNKKDVFVSKFKGKDIYKEKKMKIGTFGIKRSNKIKIKKKEIERFSKELKCQ